MKREELKKVIDDLTEIYEDDSEEVGSVSHSIHASTCSSCEGYGDTLFQNIVIVTERAPC